MHRVLHNATVLALGTVFGFSNVGYADGQSEVIKATVTYREVDGHKILADVYRPDDEQVRPVIVWIHGSALIMGHRESIPTRIRELAAAKSYAVVSIDYRLAPETKLPEIISDIEAAFRWLARDGAIPVSS